MFLLKRYIWNKKHQMAAMHLEQNKYSLHPRKLILTSIYKPESTFMLFYQHSLYFDISCKPKVTHYTPLIHHIKLTPNSHAST